MTRTQKIVLVGLLAAIPAAAFAFGPGQHGCRAESAEEAREHAARMTDRALDRVDATDDQRAKIDAVLDRAVPAIYAVHEDGAALREDGRALLTAETVDRAAAEELRKDAVALFDQGSRLAVDAMVEVASVLTVAQRSELADVMERFHEEGPRQGGHGGRGGHGGHGGHGGKQ